MMGSSSVGSALRMASLKAVSYTHLGLQAALLDKLLALILTQQLLQHVEAHPLLDAAGRLDVYKRQVLKMAKDKYYGKTLRKNFARHEEVMAMPNLLEIQKKSYQWFLRCV